MDGVIQRRGQRGGRDTGRGRGVGDEAPDSRLHGLVSVFDYLWEIEQAMDMDISTRYPYAAYKCLEH